MTSRDARVDEVLDAIEKRPDTVGLTHAKILAAEVQRLAEIEQTVIHDIGLLALGYDEPDDVGVALELDGHSGPGWYAHVVEYPEEGSHFLGRDFMEIRREATGRAGTLDTTVTSRS